MESRYYAPRTLKLVVLSLFTFGLANVHWSFRNWQYIKERDGNKSWPVARALFITLLLYSQATEMNRDAEKAKLEPAPAGLLALAFFALMALSRLPDPFWMISLLGFLPLLSLNSLGRRINAVAQKDSTPDDRFTAMNWFFILLGGIFWSLVIYGMIDPQSAG